jgi:MHS family citrate/tricarballylate:H+ symporter-like MFS transporter
MTVAEPGLTEAPRISTRRFVAAATIGNALAFYDFITYGFFAIQIGHTFFPTHNAYGSLMLSFATFGAGFLTRPIGGVVIGTYSDRVGRRAGMMLSFILMGVSIIALALVPSYAQIGIAAPILALIARLVQGFALGGEVGPNTAFLLEAAPEESRGLLVSWQGASQGIAGTLAGIVGVILASMMAPAMLESWGWRIAFLLGAVTLPFGIYLRSIVHETLHEPEDNAMTEDTATLEGWPAIRAHAGLIGLAVVVLGSGTISTYVANYLTTFAQNQMHLSPTIAFASQVISYGVGIVAVLWGGWLSDRVGRRPMMVWPNLLYLILIYPIFLWMVDSLSATSLLVGIFILSAVSSVGFGAFYAALAESLPKNIRGRTLGTVYACSIAAFGGTTSLVVTWLIKITGNPMAPGWYMLGATALGTIAMYYMRESAPVKLAQNAG